MEEQKKTLRLTEADCDRIAKLVVAELHRRGLQILVPAYE